MPMGGSLVSLTKRNQCGLTIERCEERNAYWRPLFIEAVRHHQAWSPGQVSLQKLTAVSWRNDHIKIPGHLIKFIDQLCSHPQCIDVIYC